jgi:hypothetical protein
MSSRPPRLLLLTLSIALVLAACGPAASTGTATTAGTATPEPSAPTTGPTSAASPSSAPAADQTDTGWGRIWDTIPAGFPVFPGATPADDATGEPTSARFAAEEGGDPLAIATWLQDALEQATFSTLGLNGPGEDGGYVIDSAGEGDCQVQTTVAPLGSTTFISVLYGADCPGP